jgi:hypothetical protein
MITRPGNDNFVVYTHNWIDGDPIAEPNAVAHGMETLDRRGSVKIVRTIRF